MQEFNKKLFILSLSLVVIGICLYRFPSDDGLRHVAMAFADFKGWGDVYPFSNFEVFKDYDPWFGYDFSLALSADCLKHTPVSLLTQKFVLIKVLSLFFSALFLYLVLTRSGIFKDIVDQDSFTLTYIILIILLAQPFLRIIIIRPFAFGSFFLFYTVGRKGIIRGALSSAALTFFYPYLAWFYTIPTGFAHFLKGDKKFALGVISVTIVFLCLQPSSFWGFQLALLKSDLVRQEIVPKIGEFGSTFNNITFYVYLTGFLILYPLFPKKAKTLNYRNLLIIIYLIPAMKYIRYFIDITLPLLFISFGREILKASLKPYQGFTLRWGEMLKSGAQRLKSRLTPFTSITGRGKGAGVIPAHLNLKPYIALGYALILTLLIFRNYNKLSSLREFQAGLSTIPRNSLILTDFSLQYKILYTRPDLTVIPSCEIGFAEEAIKKEYIDFLNKGKVAPLARKTGAEFLIENRRMYLDPEEGKMLRLMKDDDKLRVWKVEVPKVN